MEGYFSLNWRIFDNAKKCSVGDLPALPAVGGSPDFLVSGRDLAMKRIGKFDANHIRGQTLVSHRGNDLRPVIAGVSRMVERSMRASDPNV